VGDAISNLCDFVVPDLRRQPYGVRTATRRAVIAARNEPGKARLSSRASAGNSLKSSPIAFPLCYTVYTDGGSSRVG